MNPEYEERDVWWMKWLALRSALFAPLGFAIGFALARLLGG